MKPLTPGVVAGLIGTVLSLPVPGGSSLALEDTGSQSGCTALAPFEVRCFAGTHYIWENVFLWEPVTPPCPAPIPVEGPCYVGDIQLVLEYDAGTYRKNCSVLAIPGLPADVECNVQGVRGLFRLNTLTCYSRIYATNDNSEPGGGVPGGAGPWGCRYARA